MQSAQADFVVGRDGGLIQARLMNIHVFFRTPCIVVSVAGRSLKPRRISRTHSP